MVSVKFWSLGTEKRKKGVVLYCLALQIKCLCECLSWCETYDVERCQAETVAWLVSVFAFAPVWCCFSGDVLHITWKDDARVWCIREITSSSYSVPVRYLWLCKVTVMNWQFIHSYICFSLWMQWSCAEEKWPCSEVEVTFAIDPLFVPSPTGRKGLWNSHASTGCQWHGQEASTPLRTKMCS